MNQIRLFKTFLIVSALVLLVLVVSYIFAVSSKPILDDHARKAAPGSFIQLSKGNVHYQLIGPADAETVVLIHGLVTPSFIWDNNYQDLVAAGFRVLAYDHFGRGFSDRPDVNYDRDLYDQQLLELLQKLNIKTPVHLVGLSMGGAVATVFADRHPEKVAKLSLIAPAGFPINESLTIKIAQLPIIGDYLMAVLGDWVIFEGVKDAFIDADKLTGFEAKFKLPLKYAGLQRAILSTLRTMDMNGLSDVYQRVGEQQKPILLIWGDQDKVLPISNSLKVKQAIPHARVHTIVGAGHNLNYENPENVNPLLVEFLKD